MANLLDLTESAKKMPNLRKQLTELSGAATREGWRNNAPPLIHGRPTWTPSYRRLIEMNVNRLLTVFPRGIRSETAKIVADELDAAHALDNARKNNVFVKKIGDKVKRVLVIHYLLRCNPDSAHELVKSLQRKGFRLDEMVDVAGAVARYRGSGYTTTSKGEKYLPSKTMYGEIERRVKETRRVLETEKGVSSETLASALVHHVPGSVGFADYYKAHSHLLEKGFRHADFEERERKGGAVKPIKKTAEEKKLSNAEDVLAASRLIKDFGLTRSDVLKLFNLSSIERLDAVSPLVAEHRANSLKLEVSDYAKSRLAHSGVQAKDLIALSKQADSVELIDSAVAAASSHKKNIGEYLQAFEEARRAWSEKSGSVLDFKHFVELSSQSNWHGLNEILSLGFPVSPQKYELLKKLRERVGGDVRQLHAAISDYGLEDVDWLSTLLAAERIGVPRHFLADFAKKNPFASPADYSLRYELQRNFGSLNRTFADALLSVLKVSPDSQGRVSEEDSKRLVAAYALAHSLKRRVRLGLAAPAQVAATLANVLSVEKIWGVSRDPLTLLDSLREPRVQDALFGQLENVPPAAQDLVQSDLAGLESTLSELQSVSDLKRVRRLEAERMRERIASSKQAKQKELRIQRSVLPEFTVRDLVAGEERVDASVAEKIVFALAAPRERSPFAGDHFITIESLDDKAYLRGVPRKEFNAALSWLEQIGVVKRQDSGKSNLRNSIALAYGDSPLVSEFTNRWNGLRKGVYSLPEFTEK